MPVFWNMHYFLSEIECYIKDMCKAALDILESAKAVPWSNGSAGKWLCRHNKSMPNFFWSFSWDFSNNCMFLEAESLIKSSIHVNLAWITTWRWLFPGQYFWHLSMTQTVMPAPVYLSTCLDTVKHAHLGHLWGKVSFLARKMQKQRPGLSAPWLPTDLDLFRTHAVGTKSILKSLSLMRYNRQVSTLRYTCRGDKFTF